MLAQVRQWLTVTDLMAELSEFIHILERWIDPQVVEDGGGQVRRRDWVVLDETGVSIGFTEDLSSSHSSAS